MWGALFSYPHLTIDRGIYPCYVIINNVLRKSFSGHYKKYSSVGEVRDNFPYSIKSLKKIIYGQQSQQRIFLRNISRA